MCFGLKGMNPSGLMLALWVLWFSSIIAMTAANADNFAALDKALPRGGDTEKFSPVFDFDPDGCLPSAGFSRTGIKNSGLSVRDNTNVEGGCYLPGFMGLSNTLHRYACTTSDGSDFCGHFYALYFLKDQCTDGINVFCGHRHDWEYVGVWTTDGVVTHVGASAHGDLPFRPVSQVHFEGTHPKIVYHREGATTHALRFAHASEPAENPEGMFVTPPLISWYELAGDGISNPAMRYLLNTYNYGADPEPSGGTIPMKDSKFLSNLNKSRPGEICVAGEPGCISNGGAIGIRYFYPEFTQASIDAANPNNPDLTFVDGDGSSLTAKRLDIDTGGRLAKSIALGDVDGDGDKDMVMATDMSPTRLYLNNGSADLFYGVSGLDLIGEAWITESVALGDVDGDGDLDLIEGNYGQNPGTGAPNRLYLNNGTASPFEGVVGSAVSSDLLTTSCVALGDLDGDGDLDLVAGDAGPNPGNGAPNRLYLNNGTAYPFQGVVGANVTDDVAITRSVALGDVDGDGDLDLVAGNWGSLGAPNRLYLNNGTANPFLGVVGSDISADVRPTTSVVLGDVDRDGDLDLVAGDIMQPNRLYLNNGTASPFEGVHGSNISNDAVWTNSVALGDMDGDGDLDLVAGNSGNPGESDRLYLNKGNEDPFSDAIGLDITIGCKAGQAVACDADAEKTLFVALADMDGDDDLDVVVGNDGVQPSRLYLSNGTADLFDDDIYLLNFGKVPLGTDTLLRAELAIVNDVPEPADVLDGDFDTSGAAPFLLTGFDSFTGLASGEKIEGQLVEFATRGYGAGIHTGEIEFRPKGLFDTGAREALDMILLSFRLEIVDDDSGDDNGDCFVATAAYGSYLEPEVVLLRDFRDRYLLTNSRGRAFVRWYYLNSPPIAGFIARHQKLRVASRIAMTPIVYTIKYPIAAIVVASGVAGLAFVWIGRRRRLRSAISVI
jgi:hypothetical protein